MRIRWAGLLVLAGLAGCADAGEPLERHFGTTLPAGVRVVSFQGDAFKDPQFLWEFAPADPAFVKALVANAKLVPVPAGMDRGDPTIHHLGWWPTDRLPGMAEVYYRDPGPTDGSYYRVWVDKERDRIFVLFMNT